MSDGDTIPLTQWQPEYDSYQTWQSINETGMYTAGGLLLTSVVMSSFTDWFGHSEDVDDE